MYQDEVTNIMKQEKSTHRLGEHVFKAYDKTKHEYIRQKMREIGIYRE